MDADQARELLAALPCPDGVTLTLDLVVHTDAGVLAGCGNARLLATSQCTHTLCAATQHTVWADEHVEDLHDGEWLPELAGAVLAHSQHHIARLHRTLAARWN